LLGYGYGSTTNNGNMVSQSLQIGSAALTQSYSYDALNRLATANESSAGAVWSQTYSYDRFGNRAVTAGSEHGPNPTWTPTALSDFDASTNRLVGLSEYDAAGNLTKDNVGRQFKYDGDNKQVEFNPGAGLPVTKYFYDADGRRVKKETSGEIRAFVYNAQGQLAAEYTNGAPTGSGTSYMTTDHLGSTRIMTDAAGNPKTRHDYLPFGEEISVLSTNYGSRLAIPGYTSTILDGPTQKFTAKERDTESGLDYFGARYFSGAQGRFTSVDPSRQSIDLANPQTWNRYSYGLNSPLNYVDRNGLWPTWVHNEIAEAFSGILSSRQIKIIQRMSHDVDFKDNGQDPQNSYRHSMCAPSQGLGGCAAQINSFIEYNRMLAANRYFKVGGLSDEALEYFGKVFHVLTDMGSPEHTAPDGTPITWNDTTVNAIRHVWGESSKTNDWYRFGQSIRLAIAGFFYTFPKEAAKTGYDVDAMSRRAIESSVSRHFALQQQNARSPVEEEAARQCALGNPAACR
jgi:RHS repeat-associated protein